MGCGIGGELNRRLYYNLFSHVYDRIIALHSRDSSASLRKFLVNITGIRKGGRLLDICTGTGAVPVAAIRLFKGGISVTGLDFSIGMLKKAVQKSMDLHAKINFVLADGESMPFRNCTFNAVTCSHAMYELGEKTREKVLSEAARVLVPGGCFAMMEHCEPENGLVRLLYRIRLGALANNSSLEFARDEVPFLSRYFSNVTMQKAPGGRSKVISGFKPLH